MLADIELTRAHLARMIAGGASASPAAAGTSTAVAAPAAGPAATTGGPTPPLPPRSSGGGSGGVWGPWFRANFGLIGPLALVVFAVIVAYFYNSSPERHAESMAYFNNDKIKRCGKAAEDGGIVPPGCESSSSIPKPREQAQPAGVMTNCPAIQVGRFTVYDGASRKGCTAQGRGREQLRLKGHFTVTRLTDGPFVSIVNVRCNDFEYDGAQPVFTRQGGDNTHTCVAIGKPEDMPESMTYTITSN